MPDYERYNTTSTYWYQELTCCERLVKLIIYNNASFNYPVAVSGREKSTRYFMSRKALTNRAMVSDAVETDLHLSYVRACVRACTQYSLLILIFLLLSPLYWLGEITYFESIVFTRTKRHSSNVLYGLVFIQLIIWYLLRYFITHTI